MEIVLHQKKIDITNNKFYICEPEEKSHNDNINNSGLKRKQGKVTNNIGNINNSEQNQGGLINNSDYIVIDADYDNEQNQGQNKTINIQVQGLKIRLEELFKLARDDQ